MPVFQAVQKPIEAAAGWAGPWLATAGEEVSVASTPLGASALALRLHLTILSGWLHGPEGAGIGC